MKRLLLVLMLLSGSLQAQNKLTDSLDFALSKAANDTSKVELYCKLSKQYVLTDAKKADEYASSARALAAKINFPKGEAKALNLTGNSLLIMGNYDMALNSHFDALKIGEQIADTTILADSYLGLGIIYHKMNDVERAFRYCGNAAAYAKKVNYKYGLARACNSIGVLYQAKKEYKLALRYFQKAVKLQEELGDKRLLGVALLNVGDLHLYLDNPANGLPYLFQALRINEEIQNKMIQVTTLKGISKLYLATGKQQEALKYGKRSYKMALETGSSKKLSESAQLLHQIYASLQDYKQAYKYSTAYIEHNGMLDLENQKRIEAETTAKYETEKKELENQKLKAEKVGHATAMRHQRVILAASIIILFLMVGLVLVLFFSRKRLKEAHLKLKEVNSDVQAKNVKIGRQKDEIVSQSRILKMQNEQLEKHSLFKNKIFTIISHDLRGPFLSVKAILSLVQQKNLSERDVTHIFGLLSKDMDVSLNMLNNLLVWSKAQMEANTLQLQPLELLPVIDENMQVAAAHAEAKSIKLTQEVEPHVVALADKERLSFVLRNLLMNAIKFSYEGGEVMVKARASETGVTLAVCDYGKGISEINIPKLFTDQRYTTLGTAKEKGTGLGLMLCKEFVESLHGSIAIESEEGKGSVFTVTLPKADFEGVQEQKQTLTATASCTLQAVS
ncbi:ATP-binding protein [Pontibacter silvestris]|uniref:histidine kinase n=1 Tax=Pontibacter silvestris TaxID=2305183 RepID=A0ABW4X1T9_9BACT|nr:tetratricopeptide repeat-containing sensor histidine kinase [Pontibacter silvestris]MCC9135770.1 tetratricopeptide repeat-containing sensor histidine kinase [Pontibacter silvestris]